MRLPDLHTKACPLLFLLCCFSNFTDAKLGISPAELDISVFTSMMHCHRNQNVPISPPALCPILVTRRNVAGISTSLSDQ